MAEVWNTIALEPVLNGLIILSKLLFGSFGLAIIVLTFIFRLATFPLTQRQLRSTKAMTALQPKLAELQKKYAKDQARLQQEILKLYREAGINPLGCLWPLLVQLPIWIVLYQSIMRALPALPEDLLALSQHLYSWSIVHQALPLSERFLWLNLSQPDYYLLLPILVGGSMWLQQKMLTPATTDPRQQSMNRMMLWLMPMMFFFFSLQFPSGLALFWAASNIIGVVVQYLMERKEGGFLTPPGPLLKKGMVEGKVSRRRRQPTASSRKKVSR